jgi:putative ABC transport system ATP-binding protein
MTRFHSSPIAAHEVDLRVGDGAAATYALDDVSFEAQASELVAVTGPSGSGKTSLLHVLAGLEPPTGGSVVLAGIPLGGLDERAATKLRRDEDGIAVVVFTRDEALADEADRTVRIEAALAADRVRRAPLRLVAA